MAKRAAKAKEISADRAGAAVLRRTTPKRVTRSRRWEEWPPDKRYPQSHSGMTPRRWMELLNRYLAGEPTVALAAEYGVARSSIWRTAADRGMRKADHPGAVRLPKGPAPVNAEMLESGRVRLVCAELAFEFDRDDPVATVHSIYDRLDVASRRGHEPHASKLFRLASQSILVNERFARLLRRTGDAAATAEAPRPAHVLRESQRPPAGDWATWLFLGGRGAGKTLAGAEWLADQAEALGPEGRLALVGPTLHDVREVMIEGASGLRSLPRWTTATRPVFEAARRRLRFASGAVAYAFSAEDPDSLRGPQFAAAWADEFCAWPAKGSRGAGETLALLRMGLRLPGPGGAAPRLCVTTTPRATRALKALRDEPGCVQTHAPTTANAAHLSGGFVEGLRALYGGTRREAQELEGRVVDMDGALFTAEMLAAAREGGDASGGFDRVVVAVDPPATAGGDACGIVAAGARRRADGRREAVVLADRSLGGLGPDAWARRAVELAVEVGARAIVAEVNQGGDMVRQVLRTAGCSIRLREVRATRGKRLRAEPVAALYEQGRVRHAAAFPALEEELMALGGEGEGSLDRADALVWAVTDLLVDAPGSGPRIRQA